MSALLVSVYAACVAVLVFVLAQWAITSDFRSSDYVFEFFSRVGQQQEEYQRHAQWNAFKAAAV